MYGACTASVCLSVGTGERGRGEIGRNSQVVPNVPVHRGREREGVHTTCGHYTVHLHCYRSRVESRVESSRACRVKVNSRHPTGPWELRGMRLAGSRQIGTERLQISGWILALVLAVIRRHT